MTEDSDKPTLSRKGQELLKQYELMAEQGYDRIDNVRIDDAFADFEARAFRTHLKPIFEQFKIESVLDYGCGNSDWNTPGFDDETGQSAVEYFDLKAAYHYEPSRNRDERRQVDCLLSFDVLEHIYAGDVTTILHDMFQYAGRLIVLNVACYPAAAILPNGQNAHVTVRSPEWWRGVVEAISFDYPETYVFLMCSTKWRHSTNFPIWRTKDWLDHQSFVTPVNTTIKTGKITSEKLFELAKQQVESGNLIEALANYEQLNARDDRSDDMSRHHGLLLKQLNRVPEAIAIYQQIVAANPDNIHDRFNLSALYLDNYQIDQCLNEINRVVAANPRHAESYGIMGSALSESGRYEEALAAFKKHDELNPGNVKAHIHMGLNYRKVRQLEDAAKSFEQALKIAPDHAKAKLLGGQVLLELGRYKKVWPGYESRLIVDGTDKKRVPDLATWQGDALGERTLLIIAEQGIGDEIMFASCLNMFTNEDSVQAVTDDRLMPLFSRSFPHIKFQETDDGKLKVNRREVNCQIFSGSLPMYCRSSIDDFPKDKSYLIADDAKQASWQKRYADLPGELNVGISWHGGSSAMRTQNRSLPLTSLLPLFKDNFNVINLQYGDHSKEIASFEETTNKTLHDWPDADPIKDIDNQAAQIAALDLVISIDNSTVHLAGALGTPCLNLLPAFADWRWLSGSKTSPWYPTMRILRRDLQETEASFIARAEAEMLDMLS